MDNGNWQGSVNTRRRFWETERWSQGKMLQIEAKNIQILKGDLAAVEEAERRRKPIQSWDVEHHKRCHRIQDMLRAARDRAKVAEGGVAFRTRGQSAQSKRQETYRGQECQWKKKVTAGG